MRDSHGDYVFSTVKKKKNKLNEKKPTFSFAPSDFADDEITLLGEAAAIFLMTRSFCRASSFLERLFFERAIHFHVQNSVASPVLGG